MARFFFGLSLMGLVVLLAAGCAPRKPLPPAPAPPATQRPYTIDGQTYYPIPSSESYTEEGVASWYGRPFHGRRTASGEIYDMYALTAAHRILPMGTQVRVTNLLNHKSCLVRITDRGPFVQGRVIDLSYAAAKKVALLGSGTAPVRLEAVGQPVEYGQAPPVFELGPLTIQVGSFTDRTNAARLASRLDRRYGPGQARISVFEGGQTFYRVRVFACSSQEEAKAKLKALERDGFGLGIIVALD